MTNEIRRRRADAVTSATVNKGITADQGFSRRLHSEVGVIVRAVTSVKLNHERLQLNVNNGVGDFRNKRRDPECRQVCTFRQSFSALPCRQWGRGGPLEKVALALVVVNVKLLLLG